MEAKLLLIPWLVGVVYSSIPLFWFAIHPFAARWRRMKWSPYLALLPIWAIIILAETAAMWPWSGKRLYATPWMWVPAAFLFALGLRTYRRIFSEFGGHKLSGEAELRPEEHAQELVTTGLHADMRHPIYLAHLANFAAWTVGSGLAVNFFLLAVSLLVTWPLMIHMEERELLVRFGDRYREYQSTVPALPFLRLLRSDPRKLKSDPRKSVTRLLKELVEALPPGSATLEVKDEYNVALIPANAESAKIWASGVSGEYIVAAGDGAYHEHFEDPNEVLAFCRWVIAGNLEETIWMKGEDVVGSSHTGGSNIFLLWGFNPFRKKIKVRRKYPPYASLEGTTREI
jgi:protein-S-isoprenylcysteine O-methyltransferase Ste14